MKFGHIEKVILYDEGASDKLDIKEIADYLRGKLRKIPVEVREALPPFSSEESLDFAERLASIKVTDTSQPMTETQEPLYGEVQYELRKILGKTRAFGVIYDGFRLQRIFSSLVAAQEHNINFVHIFFTNRLFVTWGESDNRFHARTSVYGFPSIISTTGLVEAPARPKEYYLLKQQYDMLGRDVLEVKDRFAGRFIDYDDERLTEVTKGYAMQAVFYVLSGNPFCDDKGCRLYNAHWQEELLFAQLNSEYEFCEQHRSILSSIN